VVEYMAEYDDGQDVVFAPSELAETVCSVLKKYLYSLPQSVFRDDEVRWEMQRVCGDKGFAGLRAQLLAMTVGGPVQEAVQHEEKEELSEEQQLDRMQTLVGRMAPHTRASLQFLVRHFAAVAANAAVNKMTPTNIAISIYPSRHKTRAFHIENEAAVFCRG
jgi:hypothetical protein